MSSQQSIVEESATGQRFDRWLRNRFPHFNQAFIEKSLRKGQIRLNGKKAPASYRLQGGETVAFAQSLFMLGVQERPSPPRFLSLEDRLWLESLILWEDEHVLVLNKPSGIAVQGGTKTRRHIDGLLQAYGDVHRKEYRLVHRLDRDTSGILLVAKTPLMARHLTKQFASNVVKKLYLAIAQGAWPDHEGTIVAPLSKVGVWEKMVIDFDNGRPAKTRYRLLKLLSHNLSFLALWPETGRTHQLRVHMQYKGFPILGDYKYGFSEHIGTSQPRLHLHAYRLTMQDLDGIPFTFTAPLPEHFVATLVANEGDPHEDLLNL